MVNFKTAGLEEAKNPAGKVLRLIQNPKPRTGDGVDLRINWQMLRVFWGLNPVATAPPFMLALESCRN
jgi:hypothetical protein